MTEYPTRAIVFEPFVSQMEIIDKTLIEVQNQPASYYGRRNNRANPAQVQLAHNSQPHYNKFSNYYNPQQQAPQHHQHQHQQPQVYGDYYNGYRNNGVSRGVQGDVSGVNGSGINAGLGGLAALDSQAGSLGQTQPVVGTLYHQGNMGAAATHVPQVFNDRAVFAPENGKGAFSDQKKSGLSTFDPFGIYANNDYSQSAAYQPLFNSSNDFLGTTFSSNSTNIWGDTNKTMVNDAAVWG